MTPNYAYTPADDRKREQTTPGQQPPTQQPQQGVPGQPTQTPQQRPGQQTQQSGQPPQQPSPQQAPPQQQVPQQPGPPQQVQQQLTGQQGQHQPTTQQAQQQPTAQQAQQPAAQYVQQQGQQQPRQQQVAPQQLPQRRQQQLPQEPYLKPLRVTEILTEDVVTAETDTPIRTVVSQMAQNNVGSVVVVEEERPIGVITDRKVALALEEMPDIAQRTAEDLLQGDVFTADPSMNIFDAIQVMSDEGVRRLPIVDDNGALRGIVTLDDALVLLGGVVSDVADTVQSQSPRL